MKVNFLSRIVVALGIVAGALFGMGAKAGAQSPGDQKQQDGQKDPKQQKPTRQAQQQAKQDQQAQAKREQEQQGRLPQQQRARLAPQDQQSRIGQQQQRLTQYRDHLFDQQRVAMEQSAQLQRQNRTAQYGIQQQYLMRLRQQQFRIQSQGPYNYGRDPYFYTAPTYRYFRGGITYETNQYGVDLLRQAVSYGYDEGCRAGLADRQDRWSGGYEGSFAYQDANDGYGGFYVDRDDYNAYFREGFRRGYDDGYGGRYQYGRYASGRGTILGAVLATILNFQAIR
jgi:hypothetical protein